MTDEDQATDETTRISPVDIFACLIIFAVAPSTLLWLLSFEWIAKWCLYIGFAFVGLMLVEVFISDNRELKIVRSENRQLFFIALLYWIPVAICIFPAIVLVITVDVALESGVSSVEVWTHGAFQQSDTALQGKIQELELKKYRWWWPPDYVKRAFDGYILISLKKIRSDGVKQISMVGRFFFLSVYFLLTVLQVTSWMVIGFLIFRSFMWIWVRTWLKEGGSVHFSLASSKV
ncbi:MAG: hypothetical protein CME32_01250 [Gimesia sp.]|nr:hypothetical protein [Gimesia sp.]